ncbi:phosphotransferase [Paenibacillus sp. HJGM_3]|uniref:phosphotransferase n=1 Tax=Paenibacillus sp. HJGM_3 TaxID=3379816 RepID=UPI00385C221A
MSTAWEAACKPRVACAPVWLHGDLPSVNLLVEQGWLSAVIDCGTLSVGDPACDLMEAWTMLSADTRELFRASIRVDESHMGSTPRFRCPSVYSHAPTTWRRIPFPPRAWFTLEEMKNDKQVSEVLKSLAGK